MSVTDVPDMEKKINDIWKYCTEKWLRLAINDGTENKSRWQTSPFWKEVQKVRFNDGSFAGVGRKAEKTRIPDDKIIFLGGLGYISSYAAKNNITDMDEAIAVFSKDSHFFLSQYLRRLAKKPANSWDHFRDTVRLKMKKFNIRQEDDK